ncbi:hypothetical protein [Haladaptatus sp. DFWS20]|uniref:hypothetical protein n=1 Tax=Haladaptatus sp. DFWS20 TaxID=3403467 RepID=UPI003EB92283
MSNPRCLPSSIASPEAFRTTLKSLLRLHYYSTDALDRSWTFRYPDDDHRDLMVEVTQVLPAGSKSVSSPSKSDWADKPLNSEFEPMLRELLLKAQGGQLHFDLSWRFQFDDADCLDLLVEVTYLETETPGT